jgi:hypothetical protein
MTDQPSNPFPEAISHLIQQATPVLTIQGLTPQRWTRKVREGDARQGPWQRAQYTLLDAQAWQRLGACLYLVTGRDGGLRYVGISCNGLKHRWRLSPAVCATTGQALAERQLFHSQCWKHIEAEYANDAQSRFTVRCLADRDLLAALSQMGEPLCTLAAFGEDGETVCAVVERWICNQSSNGLARWNVAMTGRR